MACSGGAPSKIGIFTWDKSFGERLYQAMTTGSRFPFPKAVVFAYTDTVLCDNGRPQVEVSSTPVRVEKASLHRVQTRQVLSVQAG